MPEHVVKRWTRRQKVAKSPAAAVRRSCAAALNMTMAGADVLWIDFEHVVGVYGGVGDEIDAKKLAFGLIIFP